MRSLFLSSLLLLIGGVYASAAPPVYSSGVNEKFPHRQQLRGWATTAKVIEITLREWFGSVNTGPTVRNGSPGDWIAFLRAVPAGSSSRLSIVYLASHQTPAAEWEFKEKKQVRWSVLLNESKRSAGAPALVILDACFAAAAETSAEWRRFAPRTLFASGPLEAEYEIRFDRSRPYDAPRRFPEAKEWLGARLGKSWDGRISFLGLMWVEAVRETASAPASPAEWDRFLNRVAAKSLEFRQKENRRLASDVRYARLAE